MNKSFAGSLIIIGMMFIADGCETSVTYSQPTPPKTLVQKKLRDDNPGSKWIELMGALLPTKLCQHDSYFRECFKTTEDECEIKAVYAVRGCLDTHSDMIKADFSIAGQDGRLIGKDWGSKIGQCAGVAYRTSLLGKAVNNAKCLVGPAGERS
jgi:hypothetical protein